MLDGTQDGDMFQRKYYSEETGKEVDDEIRKILNTAYDRTINILQENRAKLRLLLLFFLKKKLLWEKNLKQ